MEDNIRYFPALREGDWVFIPSLQPRDEPFEVRGGMAQVSHVYDSNLFEVVQDETNIYDWNEIEPLQDLLCSVFQKQEATVILYEEAKEHA